MTETKLPHCDENISVEAMMTVYFLLSREYIILHLDRYHMAGLQKLMDVCYSATRIFGGIRHAENFTRIDLCVYNRLVFSHTLILSYTVILRNELYVFNLINDPYKWFTLVSCLLLCLQPHFLGSVHQGERLPHHLRKTQHRHDTRLPVLLRFYVT